MEQALITPLKTGVFLFNKYKVLKVLGKGSYSIVYLVEEKSSKKFYVLKEFYPQDLITRIKKNEICLKNSLTQSKIDEYFNLKKIFQYEAKTLKKLNKTYSSGLMKFISYYENVNNTSYIITNYVKTITLKKYLTQLSTPQDLILLLKNILFILEDIHQQNIYHQDIKLENILIKEDKTPLLIDFGGSIILYDKILGKYLNTASPDSAALEQLSLNYPPEITNSTDVYSVAALIYRILTGNYPTNAKVREYAINNGKQDPYVSLCSKGLSCFNKKTLAKIDKALNLYQEERYSTATEFRLALEKKTLWQKLLVKRY